MQESAMSKDSLVEMPATAQRKLVKTAVVLLWLRRKVSDAFGGQRGGVPEWRRKERCD